MDREEVTIHTMNPVHGRGPVYHASLPAGPPAAETGQGLGANRDQAKRRLISALWDFFAAMEDPPGKRRQVSGRAALPIRVVRGPLGRPHLLVKGCRGPAISFSEAAGNVWAALCGDGSDVGIDVAGSDEFRKEYPFQRVFHPEELRHAMRLADGELDKASALLWSIKEALVKALGCAFHLVDPLQICVHESGGNVVEEDGWHTFPVDLTGKALKRFPVAADRNLWVRSVFLGKVWLSIALVERNPTIHA